MSLKTMSTGDRLILIGNLLGSLAMTLVSLGGILRTKELPDKPMFHTSESNQATSRGTIINNSNYWER